jgi:hypothetical protein
MLSALLQGFVENVFVEASRRTFKSLRTAETVESYRKSFVRWGNPNGDNTSRLFTRIGIMNVFERIELFNGRMSEAEVRTKLNDINRLRNIIAHGQMLPRRVSLAEVERLRAFANEFGHSFPSHVMKKL